MTYACAFCGEEKGLIGSAWFASKPPVELKQIVAELQIDMIGRNEEGRGEKAEDTILRSQIEELRASTKSLMPEEFEKQLDKQQMADLIEYLMTVGR